MVNELAINLLPWRENELRYQKKALRQVCFMILALSLLIIVIAQIIFSNKEKTMKAGIILLNASLNDYSGREFQGEKFNSQSKTELPRGKNEFSKKLFLEFEEMRTGKVCFTNIEDLSQGFLFSGKAASVGELTSFLRHWHAVYLFDELQIKSIEQDKGGQEGDVVGFVLQGKGV
jgi:hypothetical protein